MRIIVANTNSALVAVLDRCLEEVSPNCSVSTTTTPVGELLPSLSGKVAVATPANSLSFMGAGYDRAVAQFFSKDPKDFERAVQKCMARRYHGYVPPHTVTVLGPELREVESSLASKQNLAPEQVLASDRYFLVHVPTMVVPEPVPAHTVFDCTWGVLAAVQDFDVLVLPAFAAGYGGVDSEVVAQTMAGAIGLFYVDVDPLTRAAAVVAFLRKDGSSLGPDAQLGQISPGRFPLDWSQLKGALKERKEGHKKRE